MKLFYITCLHSCYWLHFISVNTFFSIISPFSSSTPHSYPPYHPVLSTTPLYSMSIVTFLSFSLSPSPRFKLHSVQYKGATEQSPHVWVVGFRFNWKSSFSPRSPFVLRPLLVFPAHHYTRLVVNYTKLENDNNRNGTCLLATFYLQWQHILQPF